MICSSCGATGVMSEGGGIGSSTMARIVASSVSRRNRCRPVTASHSTTPSANTSARRSTSSDDACSGDMYSILPLRPPGFVCDTRPSARTIPKSITFTAPSNDTRMFCGETSRCTTPSGRPSESTRLCA